MYISARTPNPSTSCELGLGTAGLNGVEQSITSENIAPAGVSFFATSDVSPLVMGDLAPGDYYPVWVKRLVTPEAQGSASDNVIITIGGDGGA